MSAHAHNSIYVYHSSLLDLVQEVHGQTGVLWTLLARLGWAAPAVRVQALPVRVGMLVVWGVLVTARRHGEILSAWCVADQTTLPVGSERQVKALARQDEVRQRIEEQIQRASLRVQPGCYAVPETAFRQVAVFSSEAITHTPKGGR